MKFIKNLGNRLNTKQKTIIAIIVPLILFVITYVIAEEFDRYGHNAFDMDNTWGVWVIFLVVVGYFEFNFYSDKK